MLGRRLDDEHGAAPVTSGQPQVVIGVRFMLSASA
jgi:hypothetical protein